MAQTSRVLDPRPRTEPLGTGMSDQDRSTVAAALGEILDGTYRLLVKTHVHHWNVVGPLFHPLHLMTEAQYQDLFAAADVLAERIRALGHPTAPPRVGTEKPRTAAMSVADLVADLVADNETLIRTMRDAAEAAEEAHDPVTHDLLVARMAVHEKAVWMLRAVIAA